MPQFHFRNVYSGKIETCMPRKARNAYEAAEVCEAWCRITRRIPSYYEPVLVQTPTVSDVFAADRTAGFEVQP